MQVYLLTAVGCGMVAAAAGCSSFGSGVKGSSFKGPLVALMPTAGLEAGISGMSKGAGLGGAEVSAAVVPVAGTSLGFVAVSLGASAEGVWASAAFGGTGAVAPTGSGAEKQHVSLWVSLRHIGKSALAA
jgi:hypothetical protein